MSNLVQPFLPTHTPELANSLQIKKSSYKNIKKFIKSLDKAKIVKTKEKDQHETTIVDIDFDHALILDFVPYRLAKKEINNTTTSSKSTTQTTDTTDSSIGQRLEKIQYYKLKDRLLPLFESSGASSQSLLTSAEIKPIVTAYIESENLLNPKNKRLVTLNPTLANAVFDGSTSLDKEVLAKGSVPRDALMDRVIQACTPHHAMLRNGEALGTNKQQAKAGAAPKIKITLETRSGNKTVTKISGVESYYIAPQLLADELRKACAGSSSVEQLHGSSPKNPVMEIMIQGPQKDAVLKALERRGVRPAWVEFVDKTKGKKK
jgi:translation initiation factor 2D